MSFLDALIPSPLHPAVVHFPIVLILVGTLAALAALAARPAWLPVMAATLLVLGSVSGFVAADTGHDQEKRAERTSAQAKALVHEHEDWADTTNGFTLAAAIAALAAAWLTQRAIRQDGMRKFAAAARALTLALALCASYSVYQTGKRGGELVFECGVAVKPAIAARVQEMPPPVAHHDDD